MLLAPKVAAPTVIHKIFSDVAPFARTNLTLSPVVMAPPERKTNLAFASPKASRVIVVAAAMEMAAVWQ